jgi:NAD(P)H-nitrite reductase large subunit
LTDTVSRMTATVCYCFGVSKDEIEKRLAEGETLDGIQATTGMGYGCGGCIRVIERVWGEDATPESRALVLNALERSG